MKDPLSTHAQPLPRRLRRWAREIAVALVLTLAALIYLLASAAHDGGLPAGSTGSPQAREAAKG